MEFNKNKVVFSVIWIFLLLAIIFLLVTMKNADNNNWNTSKTENFKIWLYGYNVDNYYDLIDDFKKVYPDYKDKKILIENFTSYEDYTYTLMSALNSWVWPDIFVLNNNEKNSVFSNQILWIDPKIVNPNDFRKKYKAVFSDDLISTVASEWWNKEFLLWLPVWYETLWIFYNRRYVKDTDLKNLSTLNNVISDLKGRYSDLIPIWIWNGSTVYNSADIITQFFMLQWWVVWVSALNWTVLKEALASYLLYWDTTWYNWYNSRFQELKDTKKNSLYLFSRWEVLMVVWYPSLIQNIKANWFSKTMLQASYFPHYFSWGWKTLVNYNTFVINKDTKNLEISNNFISYLSTDSWASSYLRKHPYMMPALLSLDSTMMEQKIDPGYNIILSDFYNDSEELSSFDKWIKNIYDKDITLLLDSNTYDEDLFNKFKLMLICKRNKITTFTNFEVDCEK